MRRLVRTLWAGAAICAALPTLPAYGAGPADPYHATVRRTTHGIPHVLASDWGGLGYGYGYAFAQDNLCQIADSYVTVNGERSKYFGPDASWSFRSNSTNPNNLNSDIFFKRIIDNRVIEGLLAKASPQGPRPEVREIVRGYVAGYDRYLADTGVDNLPDPTCRGKPWVRPITEIDAYRRFYQLALLASQGVAIDGIAGAAPAAGTALPLSAQTSMLGELKQRLPLGGIGSNAVALGAQATDNSRGMLLGNPHFPWDGAERFYQAQLTIPGRINVTGGSLFGVPLVLIGHTRDLAWSHTVSTAFRFTPFEERLVPGSPTTYLVDNQPHQMKAEQVTVQARKPDGTLENRTRTLYSTVHGPILTSILGLPLFPWTPTSAYAMGDANAPNFRYLNHFFETDRAQSTSELDQVLRRNQGIPWVNTIAADSRGRAYYADLSVVPNVPDAKAQACNTGLGVAAYAALRLPVLDGSRTACNWDNDPDALQPGIFGPSHLPSLFRDDYVTNSNDSYWLANPKQPLTGFARIIGDERTARALRTRSGLVMVAERLASGRFSLRNLQDMVFANRQYAGELFRDQLAAMCEANPTLTGSNGPVDVSAACPVLRAWDVHDDLDSRGALLFRRFASRALASVGGAVANPTVFANPFDANDPVHTPNGLNTGSSQVRQALADAVTDLRSNGIPLDAPLRGHQYEQRGAEKIPIHGGPGTLGVFNAINVTWTPPVGYPDVPHGSSFVQAVQFGGGSCPRTRTILTYSESTNPRSPYFADQTRMFSRKEWVPGAFCEGDIRDDRQFTLTEFAARRSCARRARLTLAALHARGRRVRRVDAYVNGRRVKVFRARSLHRITLRSLPRRAFTLTLVSRTSAGRGGRRITSVHRFGGCR